MAGTTTPETNTAPDTPDTPDTPDIDHLSDEEVMRATSEAFAKVEEDSAPAEDKAESKQPEAKADAEPEDKADGEELDGDDEPPEDKADGEAGEDKTPEGVDPEVVKQKQEIEDAIEKTTDPDALKQLEKMRLQVGALALRQEIRSARERYPDVPESVLINAAYDPNDSRSMVEIAKHWDNVLTQAVERKYKRSQGAGEKVQTDLEPSRNEPEPAKDPGDLSWDDIWDETRNAFTGD